MDILTHIAAGMAVGSTIAVCSKGSALKKIIIVFAGALGGALPDIDAISLWSKFDATFGKLFGLQHPGKEIYSAKFWYSHHAFMHSLFAGLLASFLLLFFIYIMKQRFKGLSWETFKKSVKNNVLIPMSFLGGFIFHLFFDMPTPSGSWGGVNLFFPLNTYAGGWGKIWWWNNYDIFLIVSLVIVVNTLLLFLKNFTKFRMNILCLLVAATAIILMTIQINTRGFDFNYTQSSSKFYQKCEMKSKEIQQKELGNKLYKKMEKLDNLLPFYF